MDERLALGLWKSSFGAVKVERDESREGHIMGVWLYERSGEEVIGYFSGPLSGNVLTFSWQEPTSAGPPLRGSGYLVFDVEGRTFEGQWWTTDRARGGDWNGWRAEGQTPGRAAEPSPGQPGPAEKAPGPAEQAPEPDPDYI